MVHASLFSGFGAADLAAHWMGWENAFWCEIDGFCRQVLQHWFPHSKGYGNIKETDFTPWRGKIDVLTGGFPCQPFSVAGQRKGSADDRYLWPEMLRAIREIRPTWVIGENVAGILTMVQPGSEITVESQASLFEAADKETILDEEYVVETVCRDLEQEGYSVQPVVIPACAVGAPHRRDRVWFIANCSDARIEGVRPERENKVYGFETPTDTDGHNVGRSGHGEVGRKTKGCQNPERQWERLRGDLKRTGKERIIADSHCKRCYNRSNNWEERQLYYDRKRYSEKDQSERKKWKCRTCKNGSITAYPQCKESGQIRQEIQPEQSDRDSINGISSKRYAPYTYQFNGNLSGLRSGRLSQLKASEIFRNCRNWRNFPTQSPVCRGNDGLPFAVVRLTLPFSKWREGSIKGYGNAIVPEVMYEIFKAIETIQE